MNTVTHIFTGVLIFVIAYFIGLQTDLSDQVMAVYQSLHPNESVQSAQIYQR